MHCFEHYKYRGPIGATRENSSNLAVIRELMVQPEASSVKCPKLFTRFVFRRKKGSCFVTGNPLSVVSAYGYMYDYDYTVNSLVSGNPRELKKVSVSRAFRLRELFP